MRLEDAEKARPAEQDLPLMRTSIYMAQEVGAKLAQRALLLEAMPPECPIREHRMTQLSFLHEPAGETVSWDGSRAAGLKRLNVFVPRAGRAYAASRNTDRGPEDRSNISCLSPWIRHRLLPEEEVLRSTLSHHSLHKAEKFIQEVFWRAYFKGWLEHHPTVWNDYRMEVRRLIDRLDEDLDLQSRYASATTGATGIDCFDAWVGELLETGYLHNHTRMWFASIWIFTLRLPWQLGADFLYRHLLDGDAASNTLSWRWVAGLHTRGKNYVARASNIEKYTNGRFKPTGLAINPQPLVEDLDHPLQALEKPAVFDDSRPFGLIVTDEDCHPETLGLRSNPRGVCGCVSAVTRSPLDVGKPAMRFAQQAVTDALARAEAHFQCGSVLSEPGALDTFLIQWARSLDVNLLVVAFPATGPVREILQAAQHALKSSGIELVPVMRGYDTACWPHATRGFFKLKREIPKLVKTLDLI